MKRLGLEIESNKAEILEMKKTMKIVKCMYAIGPDLTRSMPMDLNKITDELIIDYCTLLS